MLKQLLKKSYLKKKKKIFESSLNDQTIDKVANALKIPTEILLVIISQMANVDLPGNYTPLKFIQEHIPHLQNLDHNLFLKDYFNSLPKDQKDLLFSNYFSNPIWAELSEIFKQDLFLYCFLRDENFRKKISSDFISHLIDVEKTKLIVISAGISLKKSSKPDYFLFSFIEEELSKILGKTVKLNELNLKESVISKYVLGLKNLFSNSLKLFKGKAGLIKRMFPSTNSETKIIHPTSDWELIWGLLDFFGKFNIALSFP